MSTNKTDTNNYSKQFLSGVAVLAISTFIVKIIGLFYKIPLMALLGAEGMGYFNSAYDIYSLFFVIATTGIPTAISILVSENKTRKRFLNIQKIYRISLLVLGCLGLIGTLLMSVFYEELSVIINNGAARFSILAISPTVFMICISSAIRGYFQGDQQMLPTAVSQVIEALGKLVLGLGFASLAIRGGLPLPKVAAFAVLGVTIGVALSLLYLLLFKLFHKIKSYSRDDSIIVDSRRKIFKDLLNIAIPVTLSSTILSLTKIIDMTMILGRLGDIGYTEGQANAIYGSYSTMAVSIYNLPATIISAIALPLVPLLTAAVEKKDREKEKSVLATSLKMTTLVAFPIGLGISVFCKQILLLLFPSQISEIEYTAPLLSLLGLSVFLSAMITITNASLQAYRQVKKPIISMTIGTIVKIISAFILIGDSKINIYGAPISTFLSTVVIVSINIYFIVKESGRFGSIYSIFVKPFISAFLAVASGIAVYKALSHFTQSNLTILAVILFVALVYLILILKIKAVSKEEILILPKGELIIKILTKIHLV